MAALTKRRVSELARQARRHGYYQRSERQGWVYCPLCRQEVTAPRFIDYVKGRYETWPFALDRAMREHLDPDYEACPAVREQQS